jgi:hypothetical protein
VEADSRLGVRGLEEVSVEYVKFRKVTKPEYSWTVRYRGTRGRDL